MQSTRTILINNEAIDQQVLEDWIASDSKNAITTLTQVDSLIQNLIKVSGLLNGCDPIMVRISGRVKLIQAFITLLLDALTPIPKGLLPAQLAQNEDVVKRMTARNKLKLNPFLANENNLDRSQFLGLVADINEIIDLHRKPNITQTEQELSDNERNILKKRRVEVRGVEAGSMTGAYYKSYAPNGDGHGSVVAAYATLFGTKNTNISEQLRELDNLILRLRQLQTTFAGKPFEIKLDESEEESSYSDEPTVQPLRPLADV